MRTSLPKISFFLYTFFLAHHLVSPLTYKNSGYEIYDLESTTEEQFAIEAANWSASPLVASTNPIYTQCGTAYLLGGYKVIHNVGQYERTYTNLPEHNSVHILISFYFIDRWEPQDTVSATVTNGVQTYYSSTIFKLDSGQNNWVNSVCGDASKDLLDVTLMMGFQHTGSDLKITISNSVSNANPNRGYNGFRNVRIISSMETTLPTSSCSLAPTGSVENTYKCECEAGKFKGASTCESCDESCEDCFAAGPNSCASCKSNYVYSGTQCLECHSSCATCSGTDANQCITCQSGWYLYPDNTCSDQCTGAYKSETVNGILYCKLNCPAPKYFYANNSCLDDCNSPFTATPVGSDLACNFPCDSTSFYADGSCQSTCDSPYLIRNEGGYKYCDFPCQASKYLYGDTCIDTCDSPMISTNNNGKKSCKSPCQNNDMYYYPSIKSCDNTCKDSYIAKQEQYYKTCTATAISTETTKETVVLGAVNTAADKVSGTGLVVTSIVSSGSPSGAMLGVLTKTFAYIRYLQIIYSTQLQQLLETFDTSFIPINMDSEPPNFVTNETLYKPAPELFAKWDVHPSFLMNFWSDMISFAIAGGALALFKALEILFMKTMRRADFSEYAGKGKVATQNFLLTFIYNSYGDILFFSVLEFRTTTFGSTKSYVIVPVIVFFIITGIAIFAFHVWLLKRYQILSAQCVKNRKSAELKQFLEKYKGAEMIYKGFKTDSFSHQACLLFMTFRDGLFNLIFIFLFDYPLFEVIAIMLLNVTMLVYLAIKRPLKDTLEQIHQIASEFLVFALNSSILIMAVLDKKGLSAMDTREQLGKVVVIINIIFNALIGVVMLIKVSIILKKMYKARKGGIKKMLEELNTSKSDVENMYSVQSEMHTLDRFSSRFTKADDRLHDLTFEASAPKDNPVLNSKGVDKYLGTGLERRSVIIETEMREETRETQRDDGSNSAASTRNPKLEPSSPIVIPVPDDQPLKDTKLGIWDFSRIGKVMKSALNKSNEGDTSVSR